MSHRPLFIPAAVVLSAALVTAAGGCRRAPPPSPDAGPLVVTVATPLVDTVTLFTDLTGTIQAKETVQLRPRVSGYVLEVKFKEGEEVKKDQELFVIDPTIYKAQVKQAEGQVNVYQAQLVKAKADVTRAKEAFDKGAGSKSELDVAVASQGVAEAQLFTAKANVEQAQQNLAWTTVTAPIAGRVDRAYQTPGNLVTGTTVSSGGTGTVLTTIVSVEPMYAYFDVDEQTVLYYRRMIREGKIKSVQQGGMVDARLQLLGETGYPHQGVIDFISNQLDPTTGSLTIRGTFPNPDRFLVPGLYAQAQIPASRPFEAILIPQAAVTFELTERVVYVVGPDNRVEARPVQIGPTHRGLQVVEEGVSKDAAGRTTGLSRTDRVVIRGMQRVEAGMQVDPQPGTITYPPVAPPVPTPGGPAGGLTPADIPAGKGGTPAGAKGGAPAPRPGGKK
jgi:RND family efflux transporter MFP subunit